MLIYWYNKCLRMIIMLLHETLHRTIIQAWYINVNAAVLVKPTVPLGCDGPMDRCERRSWWFLLYWVVLSRTVTPEHGTFRLNLRFVSPWNAYSSQHDTKTDWRWQLLIVYLLTCSPGLPPTSTRCRCKVDMNNFKWKVF